MTLTRTRQRPTSRLRGIAARLGLGRSLARSAGKAGILTNIVMPGLIATPRHRQTIPGHVLDEIAARNPTGRLATEHDVAAVVTFLASAANNSVTGAEIHVGKAPDSTEPGGMSARYQTGTQPGR